MRPLQLWTLTALRREPATTSEILATIERGGGTAERRQLVSILQSARNRGLIDATAEPCAIGGYYGEQFRWRLTTEGEQHIDHVLAVVRAVAHRSEQRRWNAAASKVKDADRIQSSGKG
jgi:DNA-binding PadR family transcriptional regulator